MIKNIYAHTFSLTLSSCHSKYIYNLDGYVKSNVGLMTIFFVSHCMFITRTGCCVIKYKCIIEGYLCLSQVCLVTLDICDRRLLSVRGSSVVAFCTKCPEIDRYFTSCKLI